MNAKRTVASAALLAGLLAGCDRSPPPAPPAAPPATMSQTPQTAGGQKAGSPPVQGQVDPKEPAQRRDFEKPKS